MLFYGRLNLCSHQKHVWALRIPGLVSSHQAETPAEVLHVVPSINLTCQSFDVTQCYKDNLFQL